MTANLSESATQMSPEVKTVQEKAAEPTVEQVVE